MYYEGKALSIDGQEYMTLLGKEYYCLNFFPQMVLYFTSLPLVLGLFIFNSNSPYPEGVAKLDFLFISFNVSVSCLYKEE